MRTSFSTNVRESYDLSCVVFDAGPLDRAGHVQRAVVHRHRARDAAAMLERFPPPTLEPGDVIVTNDPWIGTGHLFDINVMQPVFREAASSATR